MEREAVSHKNSEVPKSSKLEALSKLYLSFFYTGLSPKAPGTVGSLFSLPLLYLVSELQVPIITLAIIIFVFTFVSGYIADKYEKKHNLHDSKWIVIDEVLGMLTVWCFFSTSNWYDYLICFVLFRFFDILKPWPVSYLDKNMTNGYGVMLDDIAAGLMAGITYLLSIYFWNMYI